MEMKTKNRDRNGIHVTIGIDKPDPNHLFDDITLTKPIASQPKSEAANLEPPVTESSRASVLQTEPERTAKEVIVRLPHIRDESTSALSNVTLSKLSFGVVYK